MMVARCQWCHDPIHRAEFSPFCSLHCRAQQQAIQRGRIASPPVWDGQTRYAVQLPLPLVWRVVCLLCGRDRWLRLPLSEVRNQHFGPCPTCRGFRIVELDHGMERPGLDRVRPDQVPDTLEGSRPLRPGVDWRVA